MIDIREMLIATDTSPTYEWRIRTGYLLAVLRKPSKWLFWLDSKKWVKANFCLKVVSASGFEFKYHEFSLFLKRETMIDTIKMFNEICSSNTGAMKHFNNENSFIKKLCYIKQSDFRNIPILFLVDNGKPGSPVVVNSFNKSYNISMFK